MDCVVLHIFLEGRGEGGEGRYIGAILVIALISSAGAINQINPIPLTPRSDNG